MPPLGPRLRGCVVILLTMAAHFNLYKKADIDSLINFRPGEAKLGERVAVPGEEELDSFLRKTSARFIVLGVAEDVGVLANYGNEGTASIWNSFLRSFLNLQANEFTLADTIAVIGYFSFDELKADISRQSIQPEEKVEHYRKLVTVIDDSVAAVIQLIVSNKKIPIVIGGGHNNCYPIIKGTALALDSDVKSINCVNLDAHTDYRAAEGRHSGNGFRYAKQEGYLKRYFALAIHENYIPDLILKEIDQSRDIGFVTFEDVFIRHKKSWKLALAQAREFLGAQLLTGIELDLDSIEHTPASAATPCGITSREALQYLHYMASRCPVVYLHICEGINVNNGLTGKLISYMVSFFVKSASGK